MSQENAEEQVPQEFVGRPAVDEVQGQQHVGASDDWRSKIRQLNPVADDEDLFRGEDDVDDKKHAGPAPVWDGTTSLQDYLARAKIWISTTRAPSRTRGPSLLKALTGTTLKHSII